MWDILDVRASHDERQLMSKTDDHGRLIDMEESQPKAGSCTTGSQSWVAESSSSFNQAANRVPN